MSDSTPFIIKLGLERERRGPFSVRIGRDAGGAVSMSVSQPALGISLNWRFNPKSAAQMGRMLLRAARDAGEPSND